MTLVVFAAVEEEVVQMEMKTVSCGATRTITKLRTEEN